MQGSYLDKPWLQKAVDDCEKKYGFRIRLVYRIQTLKKTLKRVRNAVILLGCYVYLLLIIFPKNIL